MKLLERGWGSRLYISFSLLLGPSPDSADVGAILTGTTFYLSLLSVQLGNHFKYSYTWASEIITF